LGFLLIILKVAPEEMEMSVNGSSKDDLITGGMRTQSLSSIATQEKI